MYNYEKAIEILNDEFPYMKKEYDSNVEDFEGLPYIFYESVFVKYIIEAIQNKESDKLKETFEFVERLLNKGDEEVKNLIEVAVVESLYFEEDKDKIKSVIDKYGGSLTKKSFEECNTGE